MTKELDTAQNFVCIYCNKKGWVQSPWLTTSVLCDDFSAGSCCVSELWSAWPHSKPCCCSRQLPSPQPRCTVSRPCASPEPQSPTQPHYCPYTWPAAVPEAEGKTAVLNRTWIYAVVCGRLTMCVPSADWCANLSGMSSYVVYVTGPDLVSAEQGSWRPDLPWRDWNNSYEPK